MKLSKSLWKIFIGIIFFLASSQLSLAYMPKIEIRMDFHDKNETKPYFQSDENINLIVSVENKSGKDISISKGFSSKNFYRAMRLIDPSGSLVLPRPMYKHLEDGLHSPPLGYIKSIRAAPCEIFRKNTKIGPRVNDLHKNFTLLLPGYYSLQIQSSIIQFKEKICNIDDFLWQGLLKSDTRYFFYEGQTKIRIDPMEWKISWKKDPPKKPVKIELFHGNQLTPGSINEKSIKLNNRVEPEGIDMGKNTTILYFNSRHCIESLNNPVEGKLYPAIISGRLKNGKKFGGAQRIRIVN
jgi:hypothetical protein